jgi:hypothetical protein
MFAALLAEFLPMILGEGGALAGLMGRAGLSEVAATTGARKSAEEIAKEELLKKRPGDVAGQQIFSQVGKQIPQNFMKQWVNFQTQDEKAKAGLQQSVQHTTNLTQNIAGGGGGKQPPNTPAAGGAVNPPGQPQGIAQNLAMAKQNAQQRSVPGGPGGGGNAPPKDPSWRDVLMSRIKESAVNQILTVATFKLLDAFDSLKGAVSGTTKTLMKLMLIPGGGMAIPLILDFKFFSTLTKFAGSLADFSTEISESNRELAQWNASLRLSFAKLDIRRMQTQMTTGKETQSSAMLLNSQLGDLVEQLQPINSSLTTISNTLGIVSALAGKGLTFLAKNTATGVAIMGIARMIEDAMKKFVGVPLDAMNDRGLKDLEAPGVFPRFNGRAPANWGQMPPNLPGAVPRQPLPPLRAGRARR